MGMATTSKETVTMAIKRVMAVVAVVTMLEVVETISKTKLSKKDANTLPKI